MDRGINRLAALALIVSCCVMLTFAGDARSGKTPDAPKSGFRAEMLGQLSFVEKRIEDLAEAVPAEKYSWRPGEGVRSIGEVYVHIAGANYLLMSFMGVKSPMPLDEGASYEKTVTGKAEIIKMFKPSFDHVRNAILNLADKDLEKETKMFGYPSSYRNVLITAIAHMHEHLGQSIAYARTNGVVPPWTAAEQAAAASKDAKK